MQSLPNPLQFEAELRSSWKPVNGISKVTDWIADLLVWCEDFDWDMKNDVCFYQKKPHWIEVVTKFPCFLLFTVRKYIPTIVRPSPVPTHPSDLRIPIDHVKVPAERMRNQRFRLVFNDHISLKGVHQERAYLTMQITSVDGISTSFVCTNRFCIDSKRQKKSEDIHTIPWVPCLFEKLDRQFVHDVIYNGATNTNPQRNTENIIDVKKRPMPIQTELIFVPSIDLYSENKVEDPPSTPILQEYVDLFDRQDPDVNPFVQ